MAIKITPLPGKTVEAKQTVQALPGDFLLKEAEKEDAHLYAIVDSARNDEVFRYFIIGDTPYRSLFEGTMDVQSYGVSGFVIECKKNSPLYDWVTSTLWGQDACIFIVCKMSFDEVFSHFQQFNRVILEGDKVVLFRFYDPRVLRTYLPSCKKQEIELFFGDMICLFAESEEKAIITRFERSDDKSEQDLQITHIKISPEEK
jgi:hypothetical protein